jgi:hypothetical protein
VLLSICCPTDVHVYTLRDMGHSPAGGGGGDKFMQDFGGESRRKENTWIDLGLDGRIILTYILQK